ncbi:hypothetical protein DL96DRAFT_70560 [Flagelloscypha sp. PMI_526]|nr:hypothetical protein DL96DRAFT_70560 [Flagelloscypha sp. PMI_526]
MLNEMRFGRLSQKSIKTFKSLSRPIEYDDGIGPTELFPLRNGVDASNNARMRSLGTDSVIFKAFEGGMVTDTEQRDRLLSNFMAPRELSLKVNAQVMLIKNMEEGILANGSMGRVLSFENPAKWSGAITTNSNDKNPTKPACW